VPKAQNGLFAVLEGFGVPDTDGVQEISGTRGVQEMEASAQSSSLTEYAGGEEPGHVAGHVRAEDACEEGSERRKSAGSSTGSGMGASGGGRRSWGAGEEGLRAELEDVVGQVRSKLNPTMRAPSFLRNPWPFTNGFGVPVATPKPFGVAAPLQGYLIRAD